MKGIIVGGKIKKIFIVFALFLSVVVYGCSNKNNAMNKSNQENEQSQENQESQIVQINQENEKETNEMTKYKKWSQKYINESNTNASWNEDFNYEPYEYYKKNIDRLENIHIYGADYSENEIYEWKGLYGKFTVNCTVDENEKNKIEIIKNNFIENFNPNIVADSYQIETKDSFGGSEELIANWREFYLLDDGKKCEINVMTDALVFPGIGSIEKQHLNILFFE